MTRNSLRLFRGATTRLRLRLNCPAWLRAGLGPGTLNESGPRWPHSVMVTVHCTTRTRADELLRPRKEVVERREPPHKRPVQHKLGVDVLLHRVARPPLPRLLALLRGLQLLQPSAVTLASLTTDCVARSLKPSQAAQV